MCAAFVSLAAAVPAAALGFLLFCAFPAGGRARCAFRSALASALPLLLCCRGAINRLRLTKFNLSFVWLRSPCVVGVAARPLRCAARGSQSSQTKPEFCIIAPRLVRFAVRFWLRLCLWLPPCLLPRWVSFRFVLFLSGGRGTLRPAHRPWLLRCLCWGFARCGSRSPCRASLKLGRSGGRKIVGALCRLGPRCLCCLLPLSILIL